MKKLSDKIIALLFITAILFPFVSCTDSILDRINKDINHSTTMAPKFIMTHVAHTTAFSLVGGDYNSYLSVAVEHETGIAGQMYDYDTRVTGPEDPSNYMNCWSTGYSMLTYCLDAIDKATNEYAENYVTRGIAEVMLAYNLALATDLYGDMPWTEACNYIEYMQPKLDKQEDIYKDVFKYLDLALEDLQLTDIDPIGSSDLIYNGDKKLWTKAAYALKARYTMRLLNRSTDKTGDLNKILDYISKSFTSADEEMKFAKYDLNSYNPLYAFCRSRNYLALSESLTKKMITRNDPRTREAFVDKDLDQITPEAATFFPAPNGTADNVQLTYNQSACNWAELAPTQFISYHELLFLKAEAQARLGQDSRSTLQEAIAAAFDNLAVSIEASINSNYSRKVKGVSTLSGDDAIQYMENIKSFYDADPLKEIMVQKYLAFFGASGESVEAYNDIRRALGAGESFIELQNPQNKPTSTHPNGMFPLRNVYGSGDTTTNKHVEEAYGDGSYVYTDPVWWAGGTR